MLCPLHIGCSVPIITPGLASQFPNLYSNNGFNYISNREIAAMLNLERD